MAFSFPLPWSQFAGLMPIASSVWRLRRFETVAWTADSRPWVSRLAEPRWHVTVRMGVMDLDEAAELQALFDLHGSDYPFRLHDPKRPGPRLDLDGTILGAATPTVNGIEAEGFEIAGLPANYTISRGDLISVSHPGPMRRALYAAMSTVAADGTGVTPVIPVRPRPRETATVGNAVFLAPATGLMLALPDTFDPGEPEGYVVRGMAFEAVEYW